MRFAEELAAIHGERPRPLPLKREVAALVDSILGLLFPQLAEEAIADAEAVRRRLEVIRGDLCRAIRPVTPTRRAEDITGDLIDSLPDLRAAIEMDAEAIRAGDPAAESLDEVIAAYPGFLAIATYRVAHHLHHCGLPVLPRLLAEAAHTRTGIDIHPAASIGRSFCIDHGTGVVIGETAVIGDEVKLYQGVTLGALSVTKAAAGTKRHPTVEDRVVIYANATVLGGDTVVGHDSVVGGNVWLTGSVPPFSLVYHASQVRVRSVSDIEQSLDFVI